MTEFQRHSSHQQHTFGTSPHTRTDNFSDQTTDQREFSNTRGGGIRDEFQQQNIHERETQLKQTTCPVSNQPVSYTEEARNIDQASKQFDQKIEQIDNKKAHDDKLAHEKSKQIKGLESEAERAAREFNKEHQKHDKKLTKEQEKLKIQEEKTMKMAADLAERQREAQRLEAIKADEAMRKDAEARRLAGELVAKREQDRIFAEQKMNELRDAEEQMKLKARELAEQQARELHEFEVRQKEMNVNVEVSKKNMEELKRKHNQEKKLLDQNQANLERLRIEAKNAQEIEEKSIRERAELEQRIRELDQTAANERQTAHQKLCEHKNLQNEVEAQKQQIAQDQAALRDRETLFASKEEQRKTMMCHGKEQLKNEELAKQKAEDLASRTEKERRGAQQDVSNLTAEEQDARRHKFEMEKGAEMKVELKPATVDVFEHRKYETKEPVVTEIREEHKEPEDKGIGARIVDLVLGK